MAKWARVPPGTKVFSILNAPDDIHARHRRVFSHAFSAQAVRAHHVSQLIAHPNQLREQEDILQSYTHLLTSILHDDAAHARPVDIVAALNWTTFDIIGDLSFGQSFQNLEQRRPHEWLTTLFGMIRIAIIAMQLNTVPLFRPLIAVAQRYADDEDSFSFIRHTHHLIEQRVKNGSSRPDFMSYVLRNNRDDGTGMTDEEIDATVALLVVAGSETTATLLSGCLYLLLRNPEKMKKLREELVAEFKNEDEISIARTTRLPYLFAVLEESLRFYPPVPVSMPRVVPPEGASISGHWVPGGVSSFNFW
jgi:cytochrome P450